MLYQLWDQYKDPDDPAAPYTPYDFTTASTRPGVAKMSMTRDFARRESIVSVPKLDYFLDGNGRLPGPKDRREVTFGLTVYTDGDNDAAYWLLAAQVLPGFPQRLVYKTDAGVLWYTLGSDPVLRCTSTADDYWGGGGQVDFVVTWRIRDWTLRYSAASEHFASVSTFGAGTTFGSAGTTAIASASQVFTIDWRGTAGVDLPVLPEYGASATIIGPAGGDGGIYVYNSTATTPDSSGTPVGVGFIVPFKLPTANDSAILKFASQTFTATVAGVTAPFRPVKPVDASGKAYQREYWRIKPGVINTCSVSALGANAVVGGSIKVDGWKRA